MLRDRRLELESIGQLLGTVRDGMSRSLVLRGEPGIGKTALLDRIVETATDFHIARLEAVESEIELSFAALHHLLLPSLSEIDKLPTPQAQALSAAFGLLGGAPPDRFLVGLGALTLLAQSALERPLLVIVDDAQWLDRESADVLAFVARRLDADRVAVLFSVRDPDPRGLLLEGLPEMHLGGLPEQEALELVRAVAGAAVGDRVGRQIFQDSGGNPLALVEIAGELTPDQLSGDSAVPQPLPLGDQLEGRFLRQVQGLPRDSQTLLLLAASEPSGDSDLFWLAAEMLELGPEATAGTGRFLAYSPSVTFRHPLIRSAVYRGAESSERRRVHKTLAAASKLQNDPDRSAWHSAMAAMGPDEVIAAQLESSADRARERGGYAAAARFLHRAADLSPDPTRRAARLVAASEAELGAGEPDKARALLRAVSVGMGNALQQARTLRLEGAIQWALGDLAAAPSLLLHAAQVFQSFDLTLARTTLLEGFQAALYAGRFGGGSLQAVARAASGVTSMSEPDEAAEGALLEGFATAVRDGKVAGAPLFRHAVTSLADVGSGRLADRLRWLMLGCLAAGELLDDEAEHFLAKSWVQLARDRGALADLPVALNYLGWYETQAGRFAVAENHLEERKEIAAATGNPGVVGPAGAGDLLLLTWQGREDGARKAAMDMKRDCVERGQGAGITHADSALALLELGIGRYHEALSYAHAVYEEDLPYLGTLILPDLVEAAVRSDEHSRATSALDRLAERAQASGTQRALGLLARSRALVATDDVAEPWYREAIERLRETSVTPETARGHLLYGEWLRRQRRRLEARNELRHAHELFEAMGSEGFAERARVELLATGGRARKRTTGTADELTPQESRVAWLTSDGLSNSDIAAQLFISPSTVDYHLRKVFRKLGVSSRSQIHRLLPDRLRQDEIRVRA